MVCHHGVWPKPIPLQHNPVLPMAVWHKKNTHAAPGNTGRTQKRSAYTIPSFTRGVFDRYPCIVLCAMDQHCDLYCNTNTLSHSFQN